MSLHKFSFRVSAMLTAIALASSVAGCRFDTETIAPAGTGTFEANKYVAIGNSITAGFQSSALWETEQRNSFPALIAGQAGATDFQMPLITSPGIGTPKRQEFLGLTPTGSPIIDTAKTSGVPINLALPRAYNNLAVPGALIYDAANTTLGSNCAQALNGGGPNAFFDLVLRNAPGATTGTQVQKAVSLSPNFITFWLGNNDVLGYATSGGVRPTDPTPIPTFQSLYGQAIGGLKAIPNVKIVLLNIPYVTTIPFTTTLGPSVKGGVIAAAAAILALPADRAQLYFHKTVGTAPTANIFIPDSIAAADIGNKDKNLILLTASVAAAELGKPNSTVMRAYWQGIVAGSPFLTPNASDAQIKAFTGVDLAQPFGITRGNPFPNSYVLDATEIVKAKTATDGFNSFIASQKGAQVIEVIDINAIFSSIVTNSGITSSGELLKADYISGGLFSLDGVHPSAKAHGIVANQIIPIINREFGANLPLVNTALLSNGVTLSGNATSSALIMAPVTSFKDVDPKMFESVVKLMGGNLK